MLSGFGFEGRQVVVTGGTGALGTALIELLVREGAHCIVPCVIPGEHERFRFRGHPQVDVRFPVELADEAQVTALYAGLDRLWASVHIAGGFGMSSFVDTDLATFSGQVDMNLRTCFLTCREAARRLAANAANGGSAGGRLVNIAARPALRPEQGGGMLPYAVSKSGVATLTQGLAAELLGAGVFVNAIAPSVLDTPANRAAMPDANASDWVPLDAAAELIAWLASPANRAVTGAIVPIYHRA